MTTPLPPSPADLPDCAICEVAVTAAFRIYGIPNLGGPIRAALETAAPLIVADFRRRLLARTAGTILGDDLRNVLEDMDGAPPAPAVHWTPEEEDQPACDADVTASPGEIMYGTLNPLNVTCPGCRDLLGDNR